jgi:hypothetical protein
MSDTPTVPLVATTGEAQSETASMSSHRLDTARERIDAVCAEYNHFNPTCFATGSCSSTISCAGAKYEQRFRSPDPNQLRTDLRELFERFLSLESVAADNAYRRIAIRAWEAASDEYGAFDWEMFKEIIGDEVEELNEHSFQIDVSHLVTLRTMTVCL